MSLSNRLSCLDRLNACQVEGLALVAVLALVLGTEENQLVLSVVQSQTAVGLSPFGQSVKTSGSVRDHHSRDGKRIFLVLLRGHQKHGAVLVERIGIDVLESVLPVCGRVKDDEPGLVCALLVRSVLVVLPGGLIGNVRLGQGACSVGIHTAVFLDGHSREINGGECVLRHILGLLLVDLFLTCLGELRLDAQVKPLALRVKGRLRSTRYADLTAFRLAFPPRGHIPDIKGSVPFLRVDAPDQNVAVITFLDVRNALPRIIDTVVHLFLLSRRFCHSRQESGNRQ